MDEILKGIEAENVFLEHVAKSIGVKPLDVKFKKLDERAVIPSYAHDGDVGMDLTAISVEYNKEKDMYIYHTGLAFESDKHYGQFLFPRSSNRKTDAYLCNSVGIADSAIYRGEIIICFKNRDSIETTAKLAAINSFMKSVINEESNEKILNDTRKTFNEVLEKAENLEFAPYKVGDKVAQMVFFSYPEVNLIESEILSETERGENGFGSTGN